MLNPPCDINAREIKRDLWFKICCEMSGTFHPARLLRNIWVASLRMFWLECLQYNDNYPHLAYNDISSTYLFSVGFCWADFCWCNIWNSTATLVISCLKSKHHKVSVSVDFFLHLWCLNSARGKERLAPGRCRWLGAAGRPQKSAQRAHPIVL